MALIVWNNIMFIIRPIQNTDLESLYALAQKTGPGMTNIPKDKALLKNKITSSIESFQKKVNTVNNEYYLFVLANSKTNEIVGMSAIDAAVGINTPFYSYKIASVTRICHELNIRRDFQLLHLVNDLQSKSELCSLFLSKEFRKNKNGLLLSRARLLFLAQFPERFANIIFAEMRGVINKDGNSPFWEGLGKYFFNMPFEEADRLSAMTNKQFIADLMPRQSIYTSLLKKKTQAVIGKPHRSTLPAMKMLQKEGFTYDDYIDIFDGGPTLTANYSNINTIKKSHLLPIGEIGGVGETDNTKTYLMSNAQLNFRACIGTLKILPSQSVKITKEVADALRLNIGDKIRFALL